MRVPSVILRVVFGVAVAVALPMGCAGNGGAPSGDAFQPEVVQPDQAVVYIYREGGAMSKPMHITINQQELGNLHAGEYVAAVVTPGSFLVRASEKRSATRELKLRGGDVAYLRITGNSKPAIDEPEADVAQHEIAKTRRIGTK